MADWVTYGKEVMSNVPPKEWMAFVDWVGGSYKRQAIYLENPSLLVVMWLGSAEHYRLAEREEPRRRIIHWQAEVEA